MGNTFGYCQQSTEYFTTNENDNKQDLLSEIQQELSIINSPICDLDLFSQNYNFCSKSVPICIEESQPISIPILNNNSYY